MLHGDQLQWSGLWDVNSLSPDIELRDRQQSIVGHEIIQLIAIFRMCSARALTIPVCMMHSKTK